jgi:thiamine biosynthesis lipoprotein ApbE
MIRFFILASVILLSACQNNSKSTLQGREYQGIFMGKQYKIEVVGDSTNYEKEIDDILRGVAVHFDLNDTNSTIHRFNYNKDVNKAIDIQDNGHFFVRFYHKMEEMKEWSKGYFDPTSIALDRVLQYAIADPEFTPNFEAFKPIVGFGPHLMELKETGNKVQWIKHHRDAEWDVTEAASCWGMDLVVDKLKEHGFSAIKVSMAGKYLIFGQGPGDFNVVPMGFTGQMQDPQIRLKNRALSFKNGQDKRTFMNIPKGTWVDNDFQWVSVSAPTLLTSEIFSKAFMCMSIDEVAQWYQTHGESDVQSSIIYGTKEKMDRATTEEFDRLIVVQP